LNLQKEVYLTLVGTGFEWGEFFWVFLVFIFGLGLLGFKNFTRDSDSIIMPNFKTTDSLTMANATMIQLTNF
jgi:hypothetical protein